MYVEKKTISIYFTVTYHLENKQTTHTFPKHRRDSTELSICYDFECVVVINDVQTADEFQTETTNAQWFMTSHFASFPQ